MGVFCAEYEGALASRRRGRCFPGRPALEPTAVAAETPDPAPAVDRSNPGSIPRAQRIPGGNPTRTSVESDVPPRDYRSADRGARFEGRLSLSVRPSLLCVFFSLLLSLLLRREEGPSWRPQRHEERAPACCASLRPQAVSFPPGSFSTRPVLCVSAVDVRGVG